MWWGEAEEECARRCQAGLGLVPLRKRALPADAHFGCIPSQGAYSIAMTRRTPLGVPQFTRPLVFPLSPSKSLFPGP